MNNNSYNKLGASFLLLTSVFAAYTAYALATADGKEAPASRSIASVPSLSFKASAKPAQAAREENITLSKGNTVVFRSVVTPLSVSNTQQELLDKSKKLPKGAPIYLYLDTPGGDISSGNLLIDTAQSLGRPVHTISSFAASMGFNIVQRLSTRYVTPSGTLMAHRARVEGVSGQIPGEFLTAVQTLYREVTKMEMQNAARLGITFETYTALVKDEYWVSGEDAVAANAADAVGVIHCDDSLSGSHKETFDTFFGPAVVTFANCPAISAPLDVRFGKDVKAEDARRYRSSWPLLRSALMGVR